jgi:hypothetical protein
MSTEENDSSIDSDVAKACPCPRLRSPLTFCPQAFQEVAKGEQTAAAVEAQLDALESLIDELLADAEAAARSRHLEVGGKAQNGGQSPATAGSAAKHDSKS